MSDVSPKIDDFDQSGGARRDPTPLLDGTWGWGREDPQTGQELYNVTSEARQPMAFVLGGR